MWAFQLTAPFSLAEVTIPELAPESVPPGHVMLRLEAGGICGSDLAFYRGAVNVDAADPGAQPPPGHPMHEVCGVVVRSRDERLKQGDRVVGWATSQRGLAEYVVTAASSVHRYRSTWTPAQAIALQPLACVLSAVEQLGDVSGAHCAVLGQGPIGALFSHVLKSKRAAFVTAVDRVARGKPGAYGVDEFVQDSTARWAARGAGDNAPGVVVEAIGHQVGTLNDAIEGVRPGGRILYFGIPDDPVYPLNLSRLLRKHLTLSARTTADRVGALAAADDYADDHPGLLDEYVSHTFGRAEANEAYATACAPAPGLMKVIIDATR
jgi:threonine dehydrogenase-like Zn-dependent dehydrogenase